MAELGSPGGARVFVQVEPGSVGPVITLAGELDLSNVDLLQAVIEPLIDTQPARLTFDLSALRFMDSSGIALLLRSLGRVDTVAIRQPSSTVRRVLETTGVSQILEIEP
jgi:anti-anti-sigma factor